MDKSIPAPAAFLLAFIFETETGRTAPACYEVIFGHNEKKLPMRLTSMSLGDVVDAQKGWSKNYGSSAAGAYQFMRATLQGLSKELLLSGNQIFDGNLQDRLGFHLLKRRGYEEFVAGKISRTEFGKRLAQEWASFPVLAPTDGGSRKVTRGQSYYAGDGLNKSLTTPEEVEDILDQVKAIAAAPIPSPVPTSPNPEPEKETTMFGNLSKLFGSLVGAGLGIAVSKYGIPAEFATPEIQSGVTIALTGLLTYLFPANKPS